MPRIPPTNRMGKLRHGHASNGGKSPTYSSWANMIQRCTNPNFPKFEYYGGRGIIVCERWMIFDNFLADVGERPSLKHTIDRYPDRSGNYEQGNVRWATKPQQLENRSNSLWVQLNGKNILVIDACRKLGLSYNMVSKRIRRGWSPEEAIR